MYRKSATPPAPLHGHLVTVRSYETEVLAQIDRAHLEAEGIAAHIILGASFNPVLAAAVAGVRLQVNEDDLGRARALLATISPEESASDDEEAGVVRCPDCELAYCSFERPRLRNVGAAGFAFVALPLTMLFSKKRWRCHKCGHKWDDPKAGPASITRLEPGDPRPVFRLRRAHGGMGLFLGGCVGLLLANLLGSGPLTLLLFVVPPVLGLRIGKAFYKDLCSIPECRAVLNVGVEVCPSCNGGVGGHIDTAEEHYAAAADFRRELAAVRASEAKKALP